MNCLLCGINSKYIHPSVALYQLKANTDYDVKLVEYTIKDSVENIYKKIKPYLSDGGLLGCSCYLWNIEIYKKLIKLVKQDFPKIYILMGGPEVSYNAEEVLNNNLNVDFILSGEGEVSFDELLKYIDNKIKIEKVSNLYYRENQNIKFTYEAKPDLSKIKLATLDIKDYKNRIIYLESSRGCPYHCGYCTASLDNQVRFFPLDSVLQILKELMDKEVPVVKFLDRTFNANQKFMMEILSFINTYNKSTVFQFEVVGETLKQDTILFINSLKKKFLRFEIGVQSTNDQVNLSIFRKQNFKKLEKNIELLNKTDKVDLHVDLIAGLPYETLDSFKKSFDDAFSLYSKELQLGFLKFLKGTPLMHMIDEHGYHVHNEAPFELIDNKYISQEELAEIHLVEKMLNCYYNSGEFKHTFDLLRKLKIITSYYDFFLELYFERQTLQPMELYQHLDEYIQDHYSLYYKEIHFTIIIDYLSRFKVKPKTWWQKPTYNREELFPEIANKLSLNIEDLFRYSVVVENDTYIYVIIYKNFNPKEYIIKK